MKESLLERKVVAHCRKLGILCYKFSSPARRGVPDRILLYRGRVLFLELKASGEKPTKLQEREISVLRAAGFFCEWADDRMAINTVEAFKIGAGLDNVL